MQGETRYTARSISEFIWVAGRQCLQGEHLAPCLGTHRDAGIEPWDKFKIQNLVAAVPDLDLQVATQRISGDLLVLSVNRFTIYSSPSDKAIGVARTLFQSPRGRVGTIGRDDVGKTIKTMLEFDSAHNPTNFAVVNFAAVVDAQGLQRDRYGHSYFPNAPTVSSDLVLMLRDDFDPAARRDGRWSPSVHASGASHRIILRRK